MHASHMPPARAVLLGLALATISAPAAAQGTETTPSPTRIFEEVVVTASARDERLGDTGATMQILGRDKIEASSASTLTDLLAQFGVAYLSQWTPAQTSINLRGASTDGQGKDFRSQVVVLINGRRAGTANVSKLSLQDLERIEIVRGPGSLLYGSQAIGGVVNLITRSGVRGKARAATMNFGSFGQIDGGGVEAGQNGRLDYSFSLHGGRRGDYTSGGDSTETMTNTSYSQRGGLAEIGFSRSPRERLAVTVRSDGIYNAGFRGSAWDLDNFDSRYNQSVDATFQKSSANNAVSFRGQYYYFHDVDDMHWGTEVVRMANGLPGPGFDTDDNNRVNAGNGFKAVTNVTPWRNGTTLLGLDGEASTLRNTRTRTPVPGGATTQTAPFDNNADVWNTGLYGEHMQKFAGDKLMLRGGARFDRGNQTVKTTPNQPLLVESSAAYDSVTYRAAATARVTPEFAIRGGIGTGYRAPTATELTADYVTVQGGQIVGNENLNPERGRSVDIGTLIEKGPVSLDLDLFHNQIKDRITTVAITGNRSQYVNRGTSDITGLDMLARAELSPADAAVRYWVGFNGVYNFVMRDNDAFTRGLNSNRIDRMSEYLASVQFGARTQAGLSVQIQGTLDGPIWYETEENLLIPQAEPQRTWVHRKEAYWLWTLGGSVPLGQGLRIRANVNNLFNANAHSVFIATNTAPFLGDARFSNGGSGNSLPGRNIVVGLEWRP
ncbi:MAG: TonB-dependent receptor [Vicinamibacterales bacterium]